MLLVTPSGTLRRWADETQFQLGLGAGHSLIASQLERLLVLIGHFPHQTILGLALFLYGSLEATEGLGLYLRRRWAEYLTVLATALLIPYEVIELVHRPTPLRAAALLLNGAVVGWLAYRKRLFVDA